MKKGCAILFLLLTTLVYGQNATLLQNINYRAKELKHSLNNTGDTLVLNSERVIDKVDIFNNDYEESFIINDKETKIPLTSFPNGRYVTQVKVFDKLIIITLLRHTPSEKLLEKELTESKVALQNNAEGKSLSKEITKKQPLKMVRFYWIVKHINKGHSSSKLMRIGDKKDVERMITQHKIDLKSKAGKRNQLVVWEVYDTSAFMRFKRLNPDYANVEEADCFNIVPFYKSTGN